MSLEEILKRHIDVGIHRLITELTFFLGALKIRPSSDTLTKLVSVIQMSNKHQRLNKTIKDSRTNLEIQADLMNLKLNTEPVLIRNLIDLLVTTYKQELKGHVFIRSLKY